MNQKAYYGEFGGQYVAESLMNTLEELDKAFEEAIHDPEFMEQSRNVLPRSRHLHPSCGSLRCRVLTRS